MLKTLKWIAAPFRPRLVPSFLIIGAQKAGTSALFQLLAAHQQILPPTVKEHHFFDRDDEFKQGLSHYLRGFPLKPWRRNDQVTFEATPNYLFHESVAKRIHGMLPNLKLIVVLRDPVGRAYSAWNMYRQFKEHPRYARLHDPRSFEEAVADEINGRTTAQPHLYLARGHYAPQLRRYFDLFGRERILVLKHRDLDKDPQTIMRSCCTFLGLAPFTGAVDRLSVRDNVRPYASKVDEELRRTLVSYFLPHMQELVGLLGPEWDLMTGGADARP